jgi:hypothetical protein
MVGLEIPQRRAEVGKAWPLAISHDRWVVGAIAVLAALVWYASEPIVFTNDSFGYVLAAKYIGGVSAQGIPYYRMPLFPVFLVATGVAHYSTFFWFVLAQTALGIVMVLVFHDGLRGYSRRGALLATAIFALTFVPFVYSKSVMTEQLYLCGLIICLSSTLSYLQSGSRFRLALIGASVLIMMLTRVQGILIGFVVFPFLLLARPQHWKPILIAAALVTVTMGAYAFAYSAQVRRHQLFHSETATAPSFSNSVGKYLFMVPYLDAERYFGWKIVQPSNGPASAKLFALIDDKPVSLTQWWAIWQTLDKEIGIVASNNLLLRATIEAAIAHPFKSALIYGHNLVVSTFRLNSPYVWQHPPVTIDDTRLNDEFKRSGDQSSVTLLASLVNPLFHTALIITTILVLLSIGPHGAAWTFCVMLYGYNLLSIAASGAPEGRIVFYGLPLLLAALATIKARPWVLQWIDPVRRRSSRTLQQFL